MVYYNNTFKIIFLQKNKKSLGIWRVWIIWNQKFNYNVKK